MVGGRGESIVALVNKRTFSRRAGILCQSVPTFLQFRFLHSFYYEGIKELLAGLMIAVEWFPCAGIYYLFVL